MTALAPSQGARHNLLAADPASPRALLYARDEGGDARLVIIDAEGHECSGRVEPANYAYGVTWCSGRVPRVAWIEWPSPPAGRSIPTAVVCEVGESGLGQVRDVAEADMLAWDPQGYLWTGRGRVGLLASPYLDLRRFEPGSDLTRGRRNRRKLRILSGHLLAVCLDGEGKPSLAFTAGSERAGIAIAADGRLRFHEQDGVTSLVALQGQQLFALLSDASASRFGADPTRPHELVLLDREAMPVDRAVLSAASYGRLAGFRSRLLWPEMSEQGLQILCWRPGGRPEEVLRIPTEATVTSCAIGDGGSVVWVATGGTTVRSYRTALAPGTPN